MIERACAPDPLAKRGGSKGKGRGSTRSAQASEARAEDWGIPLPARGAKPLSQPGRHAGQGSTASGRKPRSASGENFTCETFHLLEGARAKLQRHSRCLPGSGHQSQGVGEKRRYSAFDRDGLYGASAVRWHGSGFSAGHLIADRFLASECEPIINRRRASGETSFCAAREGGMRRAKRGRRQDAGGSALSFFAKVVRRAGSRLRD